MQVTEEEPRCCRTYSKGVNIDWGKTKIGRVSYVSPHDIVVVVRRRSTRWSEWCVEKDSHLPAKPISNGQLTTDVRLFSASVNGNFERNSGWTLMIEHNSDLSAVDLSI